MTTLVLDEWDDIVKQNPDRFVLIEDPVYENDTLKKGILKYKHKSRKKVFEKAKQLNLRSLTIRYTEGIRKEKLANVNFLLGSYEI